MNLSSDTRIPSSRVYQDGHTARLPLPPPPRSYAPSGQISKVNNQIVEAPAGPPSDFVSHQAFGSSNLGSKGQLPPTGVYQARPPLPPADEFKGPSKKSKDNSSAQRATREAKVEVLTEGSDGFGVSRTDNKGKEL